MRDLQVSPGQPAPVLPEIGKRVRNPLVWAERRPAAALLLILLFVLVLGGISLHQHPPSFEFNWENRWWQIALNFARGDGYIACKPIYFPFCGPTNQVTAMREPLPVLLFALIALWTNESLLAAAVSVIVINLGIVIAVFFLTRELSNTRAGVLAAVLWACYLPPFHILYSQPSGDLFATLAVTCGILYFLRARRTARVPEWLCAGGWLGLATLSRSAGLVIVLALGLGLLVWHRPAEGGRSLRPFALFVVAWALIVFPWYVRNHHVFGRPVIGSTLAGYYLYRQNYMLPTDNYLRFVTGGEFVPVIRAMIARRPDLQGTENEAEMEKVYREEAVRVIRSEPLRYMALSAYRFFVLWLNWGVPEAYHQKRTPGDYLTMLQHALLLVGAALGLRGRWDRVWPLPVSVVALSIASMAVMALITYALPVVPFLTALTAIALTQSTAREPEPAASRFR